MGIEPQATKRQAKLLETTTGYLSVRSAADDRRLWQVVRNNMPMSVQSDLRTALGIARRTFGRVTLSVWDMDVGVFTSEMIADPNY